MTGKLWREKDYVSPAPDPKLVLTQTPHGILAQYNAVCDRDGKTRRLAYFVEPNMERIGKGAQPDFTDPAKAGAPIVIPILSQSEYAATKPELCAVYFSNNFAFSIYCRGEEVLGPCGLPVFKDRHQTAAQVALTPLAVVGDASVVGTCVGACVGAIWGLGQAGYSGPIYPIGYTDHSAATDPHK